MSKVIHLSDDAHYKAKEFCREHAVKMSDWVATLIDGAIRDGLSVHDAPPGQRSMRALVQKKKHPSRTEDKAPAADDGLPVYASPPFWAAKSNNSQA